MAAWAFLVLLHLPSFGGQVEVRFTHGTLDGCERMRRVITRELAAMTVRHEASRCEEVRR